jgi:hypothetical protein
MTRQRRGETIEKRITERCSHCGGRGFVRSAEAVSLAFLRDLRSRIRGASRGASRGEDADGGNRRTRLKIAATFHPSRALEVANRLRAELSRLEATKSAVVQIVSDDHLGPDQFGIDLRVEAIEEPPEMKRAAPAEPVSEPAAEPVPEPAAATPVSAGELEAPGVSPPKKAKRRRRRSRKRAKRAKNVQNT